MVLEYLATFARKNHPNVDKYTIHGEKGNVKTTIDSRPNDSKCFFFHDQIMFQS
jgi:hypothetical protein